MLAKHLSVIALLVGGTLVGFVLPSEAERGEPRECNGNKLIYDLPISGTIGTVDANCIFWATLPRMASTNPFERYQARIVEAWRGPSDVRASTLDKANNDFVEGMSQLASDAGEAGSRFTQLAGLLRSLKDAEKSVLECTEDALLGKTYEAKTENGLFLRCSVDKLRNTYSMVALNAAAQFELQIPLLA